MLNNVLEEQSDAAPQVLRSACQFAKPATDQETCMWCCTRIFAGTQACWTLTLLQ